MKVQVTFKPEEVPMVELELTAKMAEEYVRLYNLIYLSHPPGSHPEGIMTRFQKLQEKIKARALKELPTPIVTWVVDDITHPKEASGQPQGVRIPTGVPFTS